jgi:hypothetical protein
VARLIRYGNTDRSTSSETVRDDVLRGRSGVGSNFPQRSQVDQLERVMDYAEARARPGTMLATFITISEDP